MEGGRAMEKEIQVGCPCCKNRRLFDANPNTEGVIKIRVSDLQRSNTQSAFI